MSDQDIATDVSPIWEGARFEVLPCGLCGSSSYDEAGRRGDGLTLVECTGCGTAYLRPMPDEDAIRTLYQSDYFGVGTKAANFQMSSSYDAAFADSADPRRLEFRVITDHWGPLEGSRVLEVGCGGGHLLSLFAERGAACEAVELNPEMAERVRTSLGIRVHEQPFEQGLPVENERFDIIIAIAVLEHIARPGDFLDEVTRLLRPGGLFFMSTPNWFCAKVNGRNWVCWTGNYEHLCYLPDSTLRQASAERGMHLVVEGESGALATGVGWKGRQVNKRLKRWLKSVPLLGPALRNLKRQHRPVELRAITGTLCDYTGLFRKDT